MRIYRTNTSFKPHKPLLVILFSHSSATLLFWTVNPILPILTPSQPKLCPAHSQNSIPRSPKLPSLKNTLGFTIGRCTATIAGRAREAPVLNY